MITYLLTLPYCFEEKTDYRSLSRVLTDIAHADNLFIVDFQGAKWKTYIVKNYLEKYSNQIEKRKVDDLLNLVSKKILKNGTSIKINSEETWLQAGKEFSEKKELGKVLLKEENIVDCKHFFDNNECLDIEQIDIDPKVTQQWKELEEKEKRIYKSEEEYENALIDILSHSTKIKIIDPYLTAKNKFIVELVAEYLGNREGMSRQPFTEIELHVSYKWRTYLDNEQNDKEFRNEVNQFKKILSELKKKYRHMYKVFYWDQPENKGNLHDRYIITDIIGIGSKHSFSTDEKQLTEWNILTSSKLKEYRKNYNPKDALFELKYDPLIV